MCENCHQYGCDGNCIESYIIERNVIVRNKVKPLSYGNEGSQDSECEEGENGAITICQLLQPSKRLESVLKDIVSKYCQSQVIRIEYNEDSLSIFTESQDITVDLKRLVESAIIDGISVDGNKLIFNFCETETIFDFGLILENIESKSSLIDNKDGTYTYTSSTGTKTIIRTQIGEPYVLKSAFETSQLTILIPKN